MLRPLDRDRRDGPLYPGSDRTLRDLIEPNHLLLQIEQAIDLAALAADLEQVYDQRRGRPAIHPEVVVRALLLAALYQVPSYRQLCARISENLAWRYFCHLTLDDPVFDHSTLSVFLDRIGPGGVQQLVDQLNASFADAGLFSSQLYLDSSLMSAAVRTAVLSPREAGLPPPERAGGIFVAREQVPGSPQEPGQLRLLRYQDQRGQLPLPIHDPDARWKTIRGPAVLGYKEHLIVDRSGFILARRTTGADVMDVPGVLPLFDHLPVHPRSVAADSGYRDFAFRWMLRRRGIAAAIPLAKGQVTTRPAGFVDQGDHLICPQGTRLLPLADRTMGDSVRFAAPTTACIPCPQRATCLSPGVRRKEFTLSRYRREGPRAQQTIGTLWYDREQRRRATIVEGVFARLDRLGSGRLRVRGLDRVEMQNALTALAHNILKALTKRRFWSREAAALPRPTAQPLAARLRPLLLHTLDPLGGSPSHPAPLHH